MKFSTIFATALVAATGLAQDVACRVNGIQQSVVDLETGECPFVIPSSLPVNFRYDGADDYFVDAYYAFIGQRYFNDIPGAGRVINIPARLLYDQGTFPLYHIHAEESPASNSTAALRKRFNSQLLDKRDELSDFVDRIKSLDGVEVPSDALLSVNNPDVSSSAGSGSGSTGTGASTGAGSSGASTTGGATGASTTGGAETDVVTNTHSTLITITSCSENKCSKTTVPATWGPVTSTVDEEVTVYTTWCPVTEVTVTEKSTKIITITSCANHKCSEVTTPATWGPTTKTVEGEVTVYTTWCPVASTPAGSVETSVVTSAGEHTTVVYTTVVTKPAPGAPGASVETSVVTSAGEHTTVVYTTVVTKPAPGAPGAPAGTETAPGASVETSVVTSAGEQTTVVYTTVVTKPAPGAPGAPGAPAGTETAPGAPAGTTVAGESTLATVTTGASSAASAPPAISTSFAGAAKVGGSLIALMAIPFAYLL
ncbi:CIC11C00000005795 [Sungouiella intermedia]|uniref:CIC11C00000005795 n=1 Tax=Sungouiella intermedia TaxID=45354 RepID=A0A1L0BG99_9ASCO|nr:CIC11C00000005795 [[Candida] intermedia]